MVLLSDLLALSLLQFSVGDVVVCRARDIYWIIVAVAVDDITITFESFRLRFLFALERVQVVVGRTLLVSADSSGNPVVAGIRLFCDKAVASAELPPFHFPATFSLSIVI